MLPKVKSGFLKTMFDSNWHFAAKVTAGVFIGVLGLTACNTAAEEKADNTEVKEEALGVAKDHEGWSREVCDDTGKPIPRGIPQEPSGDSTLIEYAESMREPRGPIPEDATSDSNSAAREKLIDWMSELEDLDSHDLAAEDIARFLGAYLYMSRDYCTSAVDAPRENHDPGTSR